MTIEQSVRAAEAIIFASGDGITFDALGQVLEADEKQMMYILDVLKDKYYDGASGIVLPDFRGDVLRNGTAVITRLIPVG